MCGLKAAQIYRAPFRATKEYEQPSAAQNQCLPNYKKISILVVFSSLGLASATKGATYSCKQRPGDRERSHIT